MPEINPFKEDQKAKKQERVESVGEANIKIGEWVIMVMGLFGFKFYDFEREALYKAVGPIVRKFPRLRSSKK